jgi:hypothetical protein
MSGDGDEDETPIQPPVPGLAPDQQQQQPQPAALGPPPPLVPDDDADVGPQPFQLTDQDIAYLASLAPALSPEEQEAAIWGHVEPEHRYISLVPDLPDWVPPVRPEAGWDASQLAALRQSRKEWLKRQRARPEYQAELARLRTHAKRKAEWVEAQFDRPYDQMAIVTSMDDVNAKLPASPLRGHLRWNTEGTYEYTFNEQAERVRMAQALAAITARFPSMTRAQWHHARKALGPRGFNRHMPHRLAAHAEIRQRLAAADPDLDPLEVSPGRR